MFVFRTTLPTAAPFPGPLPKGAVDVSIIMDASDAAGSDNLTKVILFTCLQSFYQSFYDHSMIDGR